MLEICKETAAVRGHPIRSRRVRLFQAAPKEVSRKPAARRHTDYDFAHTSVADSNLSLICRYNAPGSSDSNQIALEDPVGEVLES